MKRAKAKQRVKVRAAGGPGPAVRMRESEVRLRMALDAADMVTWEWNVPAGTVQYSSNIPDILRGDAVEPYSAIATILHTVHPDDRSALSKALDLTAKEGCPFVCEYRVRMLDGQYHWILGRGRIVVFKRGRPVRVLGVSQDITARKKAEEEIRLRSRQLARLASELTMAEHRERRRLADLLHEHLQQMLVGARMQVHGLSAGKSPSAKGKLAELQRTLDEVLAATRSITKMLVPPLSVRRELSVALRWLALDMQERCLMKVSVRTPGAVPLLPEPLTVLLFTAARELLLNISKHSGSKRARLWLRMKRGMIELEVRDWGRGIDAERRRVSNPDRGFGLFSIEERAELLGGKLVVDSAPGQGARIVLSLPVPARGRA